VFYLFSYTHTHPPSADIFIWDMYIADIYKLSASSTRGAAAWGSVSQTHADGWAGGAGATLYWVSCDYPAPSQTHTHTERERWSERWRKRVEWMEEG